VQLTFQPQLRANNRNDVT